MNKVMVIGGGPAGLAAAKHLSQFGQEVILIEKEAQLGGRPRWYNCKTVDDCRSCGACLVSEKVYKVNQDSRISIQTCTEVVDIESRAGIFRVHLVSHGEISSTEVSGIVFAVGFSTFDAGRRPEMGYGFLDRVVTVEDLEELLRRGPENWEETLGCLPRIAIIKCFASRETKPPPITATAFRDELVPDWLQDRWGVPYCSRICCLYAEKLAAVIPERVPGAALDVFCIDNQNYHPVYEMERMAGIRYLRGMPSRVYRGEGSALLIRYEDGSSSHLREDVYDWVVLCPAVTPYKDQHKLIRKLGLSIGDNGFIGADESEWPEGVKAAGGCMGPRTILESLASGQSAAGRMLRYLGDKNSHS